MASKTSRKLPTLAESDAYVGQPDAQKGLHFGDREPLQQTSDGWLSTQLAKGPRKWMASTDLHVPIPSNDQPPTAMKMARQVGVARTYARMACPNGR